MSLMKNKIHRVMRTIEE